MILISYEVGGSLLLHPLRRKVYSIIVESPGSYFLKLINVLNAPQGTLSWHIKRLEKEGLIGSIKFGGKRVYFPMSLRSADAEKIFLALQNETAKKILLFVYNHPGQYQLQIAKGLSPPVHHDTVRYHLSRLEELNLVRLEKNRMVRVFPGKAAEELQKGSLNAISDAYVSYLMEKLREGCLHPEIVIKTTDKLILRVECPEGEDMILDLKLSDWNFFDD
ncbi:MAG: winged helix-turn-helix transcriptional regulator [Promethearchaeota archaeon]